MVFPYKLYIELGFKIWFVKAGESLPRICGFQLSCSHIPIFGKEKVSSMRERERERERVARVVEDVKFLYTGLQLQKNEALYSL